MFNFELNGACERDASGKPFLNKVKELFNVLGRYRQGPVGLPLQSFFKQKKDLHLHP
jgi:hypothetical protein